MAFSVTFYTLEFVSRKGLVYLRGQVGVRFIPFTGIASHFLALLFHFLFFFGGEVGGGFYL